MYAKFELLDLILEGNSMLSKNINLHNARRKEEDEFYTQLSDIGKELKHYKSHFKDKVIYCNCDDYRYSNFYKHFVNNFESLGLKKLIASHYKERQLDLFNDNDFENPKVSIYEGRNKNEIITLRGDGDFRSQESIEFLKQSDIVITNPPFSLFREYIN